MLFNSFEFAVFFPAVVVLYFLLPQKWRWGLLLAASYYFYMCWRAEYALLLVASTVVDYLAAYKMEGLIEKRQRRPWLLLSIVTNLGILFTFKYFNFFNENLDEFFVQMGITYPVSSLEVLLPMGISFYTFQTMSYTIDVYNGNIKRERHFGKFALFVTFFPQLVAGPIERAKNLLPQFSVKHRFEYTRVVSGLKQMLWGFFKKLVIADRLSMIVNEAYSHPQAYDGWALLVATYCFAFQIYCDFSGYSDIAIGAARVLGYDIMENFRVPYLSRSIREFWTRWHISLSTWFRDYLYIPLGGNRVTKWRWYYNLIIVFLVSGFWHGANWTFIVWGGLHGLYLIVAILLAKFWQRLSASTGMSGQSVLLKAGNVILTFHLTLLAWIFFRANSIGDAQHITGSIMGYGGGSESVWQLLKTVNHNTAIISLVLLGCFVIIDPLMDKLVKGKTHLPSKWISYLLYATITAVILIFGYFGQVDFIYFQF